MNASDLPIPHDADQGARLAHARWADPAYIADRYSYREGDIWLGRCPHDPNRAIGYRDDRHVFLCAETRSGKGRALLVNNQVLWPGSLIAIDPKGEAATIAAARRGTGNAHCDGLGQEVYILDPSGMDLPPELDQCRAHFNPLGALRKNDPQLVEKTRRVAKAICEIKGGDASVWDERGRNLVANVIRHVITAPPRDFEEYGLPRDLTTVRSLILAGHRGLARRTDEHHRARAAAEGKIARPADPFELLFEQMAANPACNGEIALGAHDMLSYLRGHVEGFQSVRSAAARQLEFLAGYGMCKTVTATGARDEGTGNLHAYPRSFRVEDLKDAHISVFLCVKQADYESFRPWLRAMVEVLIDGLSERQGLGKSGQRVLFCIDEFASLGEMEQIAMASDTIAGAGVKLMIAVQRLSQLKQHYGAAWETFIASAGAQVWYGAEEEGTRKYIEQSLGNTEVTIYEDSIAIGHGTSIAEGVSEVYSHTNSLATTDTTGHSRTHNETRSRADGVQEHYSHADTQSEGTSRGGSESHGTTNTHGERRGRGSATGSNWNYGTNDGRTADKGYGPHLLFEPWEHTTNRGTNFSRNRSRGGNQQESWSNDTSRSQSDNQVHATNYNENSNRASTDTRGGGTSRIDTVGTADGQTDSTSQSRMTGTSDGHARGTSHIDNRSQNQVATRSQRRHVIPLLSALEAKQYLRSFDEPDREHAAFPGLALIILSGEPYPFFVRKANHDQDPFFVRKFNPNPAHPFIPFDEQPLLGWQITDAHRFSVRIPEPLIQDGLGVEVTLPQSLRKNAIIESGKPVLSVAADVPYQWHTEPPAYGVLAPVPLKVLNLGDGESRQQGRLMLVRAQTARLPENWQEDFEAELWLQWLDACHTEKAKRQEIEAERRRQEAERKKAEQAHEAERRRVEQEALEARRRAEEAREAERREAEQRSKAEKDRLRLEKETRIRNIEERIGSLEKEVPHTEQTITEFSCLSWAFSFALCYIVFVLVSFVASGFDGGVLGGGAIVGVLSFVGAFSTAGWLDEKGYLDSYRGLLCWVPVVAGFLAPFYVFLIIYVPIALGALLLSLFGVIEAFPEGLRPPWLPSTDQFVGMASDVLIAFLVIAAVRIAMLIAVAQVRPTEDSFANKAKIAWLQEKIAQARNELAEAKEDLRRAER